MLDSRALFSKPAETSAEKDAQTDAEKEIAMIANLAEVDICVIEELDLADYGKIQQSFADFFPSTPEISD